MKPSTVIVFVALAFVFPAAASAQIVIERLNEDIDPVTAIPGEEPVPEEEPEPEPDNGGLTAKESEAVKKVLVSQISEVQTRCLKAFRLRRGASGEISGTASWILEADGKAKFQDSSTQASPRVFFSSSKEYEEASSGQRKARGIEGNGQLSSCTRCKDAIVPVKGKKGSLSVKFDVQWKGGKAIIDVKAFDADVKDVKKSDDEEE